MRYPSCLFMLEVGEEVRLVRVSQASACIDARGEVRLNLSRNSDTLAWLRREGESWMMTVTPNAPLRLNGLPVNLPRVLCSGDRIEVADQKITYLRTAPPLAADSFDRARSHLELARAAGPEPALAEQVEQLLVIVEQARRAVPLRAAQRWMEKEDWTRALQSLEVAPEGTEDPQACYLRCICLANLGRFQDVIQAAERGLSVCTDNELRASLENFKAQGKFHSEVETSVKQVQSGEVQAGIARLETLLRSSLDDAQRKQVKGLLDRIKFSSELDAAVKQVQSGKVQGGTARLEALLRSSLDDAQRKQVKDLLDQIYAKLVRRS